MGTNTDCLAVDSSTKRSEFGACAIAASEVDHRSITPSRSNFTGSEEPQGMSENDTLDWATFRKNDIVSRE